VIFPILGWWLISTLLGMLAFPIAWRIFSRLPDRGFGFTRALGLLITGYLYWLGASLQILPNTFGSLALVLLITLAFVIYFARTDWAELVAWLRARRRTVLVMEVIFVISFIAWAFVRANNPEITGTEKPMELAFVNAILKSEGFPPRDPWLSGYAISYYYFGYVLLGMLIQLSGVTAGVGFNLGNSLWFALVAVGSFSLLFNLVNNKKQERRNFFGPLLGPILVLITGNLGGFLEVLHSRHLFWKPLAEGSFWSRFWSFLSRGQSAYLEWLGNSNPNFWTWLGLQDLENFPLLPPSWIPQRFLWWWRSSRVIRDLDLRGVPIGTQSIDEFPFFSFLLADNHPHLLALPFVLLAIGFVLQIAIKSIERGNQSVSMGFSWKTFRPWLIGWVVITALQVFIQAFQGSPDGFDGVPGLRSSIVSGLVIFGALILSQLWSGKLTSSLTPLEMIAGGWLFGALAFLNTWDLPIYLSLLGLILIWQYRGTRWLELMWMTAPTLFSVLFLGFVFYLPWYPTFASQAGGILPHMLQPTRFPHFVVMFGPSLIPLSAWLLSQLIRGWSRDEFKWMAVITVGLPLGLLVLAWLLASALVLGGGGSFSLDSIYGTLGVNGIEDLIRSTLRIRLTSSWTALYLGGMTAAAVVLLRRDWNTEGATSTRQWILFLLIVGSLLILGPEFLYLRDQFGLRMNTIFKFYFAAWILWSLAAGYSLLDLWRERGLRWVPVQFVVVLPLILGMIYPVLSVWTKTQQFQPFHGRTLDGSMHPAYMNPDDRDAISWMNAYLPNGTVVEAVGGSYTYFARVSTHTGYPTVLGWPGHEGQWRGGYREQGSRFEDIRQLYQTPDWLASEEILDRYQIDYVYIGDLEKQTYLPVFEAKFDAYMQLIYSNESVKIYARGGDVTR
jgi:uncharacterized membrane protein